MPTRIVLASPKHAAVVATTQQMAASYPLSSPSFEEEGDEEVDFPSVVGLGTTTRRRTTTATTTGGRDKKDDPDDSILTAPEQEAVIRTSGGGWLTQWFWGGTNNNKNNSNDLVDGQERGSASLEFWDAREQDEEDDVEESPPLGSNSYDDWEYQELVRLEQNLRESLQRRESWLLFSGGNTPPSSGRRTSRIHLFSQSTRRRRHPARPRSEHLSSLDITASPRLIGYIQIFTASLVLLVSAVRFVNQRIDTTQEAYTERELFVEMRQSNQGILRYKLDYTLYWGIAGASVSFLLILGHFDNVVAPSLWRCLFRDGSYGEASVLAFLTLFWVVGIHVCTSAFSIGESQPNVFLSVWFAFLFTIKTVAIWRSSAGWGSVYAWLQGHERRTSLGWAYVLCFAGLALGSVTDYYVETFWLYGEEPLVGAPAFRQRVRDDEWYMAFGLAGGTILASGWALVVNTLLLPKPPAPAPAQAPLEQAAGDAAPPDGESVTTLRPDPVPPPSTAAASTSTPVNCCVWFLLDWMYVELILIAGVIGTFAWMIFRYTGITGLSSTPQNPYVSFWGCFFAGTQTLGLWLAENQSKRVLRQKQQQGLRQGQATTQQPGELQGQEPGGDDEDDDDDGNHNSRTDEHQIDKGGGGGD